MQRLTRLLFLMLVAFSFGACTRQPLPSATPPVTQVAVATAGESAATTTTPLPTLAPEVPTLNASPLPSATPAPTQTALPSPTATNTPAYCPDEAPTGASTSGSLRVFFVERGDLRLWDEETGTTEMLAEGGVYRLYPSPDGETIAFLRQEERGIADGSKQMALWAVDADGGNERLLISGDAFRALGPERVGDFDVLAANPAQIQWLPGTNELAFRVYPVISALGAAAGPAIHIVNVQTGLVRAFLTTEGDESFSFSPGEARKRMTVADDTGIDLLVIGGGGRSDDVVAYPHIGLGHSAYRANPVWAEDGSAFSLALPSADPFGGNATLTVWEVAADGGNAQELATFTGFPLPTYPNFGSAIFSPDRSQIAFYRAPERSNQGELIIAEVTGAWKAVYDAGLSIRFLGWAPDGGHFAYAFGPPERHPLRIGRLCQAPSVFEGPPVAAGTPVTWVDGERFLYQSGEGSSTRLLLGALDGSVREIGELAERLDSYAFTSTVSDPGEENE